MINKKNGNRVALFLIVFYLYFGIFLCMANIYKSYYPTELEQYLYLFFMFSFGIIAFWVGTLDVKRVYRQKQNLSLRIDIIYTVEFLIRILFFATASFLATLKLLLNPGVFNNPKLIEQLKYYASTSKSTEFIVFTLIILFTTTFAYFLGVNATQKKYRKFFKTAKLAEPILDENVEKSDKI